MVRCAPLLALAFSARAAAASLPTPEPRAFDQTVYLPASSAASVGGADALLRNPAGLTYAGGLELDYLHQRSALNDRVADGAYLAWAFGDLALGASMEWVRYGPSNGLDFRRTSYTLALGDETLSLGASLHLFGGTDDPRVARLTSWDLGITARPARFLAAGFSVLDVNAPTLDVAFTTASPAVQRVTLPRRYDAGLAIRPFGERLDLAADLLVDDQTSWDHAALAYTARVRAVDGITVFGGVTHYYNEGNVAFSAGLQLDTAHVGFGFAGGVNSGFDQLDSTFGLRVSSARFADLHPIARFARLDLNELLSPPSSTAAELLGFGGGADPYLSLVALLRRAKEDHGVQGLVLQFGGIEDGLGAGHVAELRDLVLELRKAGKPVVALLTDADDGDYELASACDKVYAVPEATLLVNGLSTDVLFLGEALGRIGVHVDVARVGAYKNAPDQLTRADMSPEQREALEAFVKTVWTQYEDAVTTSRKIDKLKFESALARGILTPAQAKEAGLIDDVAYPDELNTLATQLYGSTATTFTGYEDWENAPDRWGGLPRIALVRVQGDIVEGKSVGGPLGGQVAGADTIVKGIEAARDDDAVKAIVVRVDSPGGSGNASNLIYRALMKAREKKPVVVSMGNTAASGGYYVAIGGDSIWAEPTTLTGSIGVFVIKPDLSGLLSKLSVHDETVKQGDHADVFSLARPWTESEQAAMQQYTDEFYDRFISLVAERRKLDKTAVDAVARGRIWSGADAKERGLVDNLGGLQDALADAKKRAGMDPADRAEIQVFGSRSSVLPGALLDTRVQASVDTSVQQTLRALGIEAPARETAEALRLVQTPGVLAVLPFSYRVH